MNPHTIYDTLNITDLAYFSGLKIPGPLHSGILYTAPSFPLLEPDYNGYDKYIYWAFNKYNGTRNEQVLKINKLLKYHFFQVLRMVLLLKEQVI